MTNHCMAIQALVLQQTVQTDLIPVAYMSVCMLFWRCQLWTQQQSIMAFWTFQQHSTLCLFVLLWFCAVQQPTIVFQQHSTFNNHFDH